MKKRVISLVLAACMACALFIPGASALGEVAAPPQMRTFSIFPPATEDFIPQTAGLLPEDVCEEVCEHPNLLSADEEAILFSAIICNACGNRIYGGEYIGSYKGAYEFNSSVCYRRYDLFRFGCSCGWYTNVEESTTIPHSWGSYDSSGTRYCSECGMGSR